MTGLKFILAIVSPRPAPSVARFRDGSSRSAEKSRWRNATFETIRIRFLKIATRIQPLRTRICFAFPSGPPERTSDSADAHQHRRMRNVTSAAKFPQTKSASAKPKRPEMSTIRSVEHGTKTIAILSTPTGHE